MQRENPLLLIGVQLRNGRRGQQQLVESGDLFETRQKDEDGAVETARLRGDAALRERVGAAARAAPLR